MGHHPRVGLPRDWKTAEYGSHWPVLLGVLEHFPVRRVLELGSGKYSTNLILRSPRVERLVSIENNPEWAAATKDPRHTLTLVEGPVAGHLPELTDFDLVFIDDDPADQRARTIERVLRACHPLVVLHDADFPEYHDAISDHFPLVYSGRKPWTALIWPT